MFAVEKRSDDQFIDLLKASPTGEKIVADLAKKRTAERAALGNELSRINVEVEKSFPALTAAVEKAAVAVRDAERALQEAKAKHGAAHGAKLSASLNYTSR